MIRFYCLVIPCLLLIIIPHRVHSFYLEDVTTLKVTRNISCQLNNSVLGNNYQLCAVRIYNGTENDQSIVYNGLRYLNTFHQFIEQKCPEWSKIDDKPTDIGSAICRPTLPYETFSNVQLCICATDNCNRDLNSCINSNNLTTNISSLVDFMPVLNRTIQCSDASDSSNTCNEHKYINKSVCQDYVKNNSVLCVVSLTGDSQTETLLIYENYEAYLDEKIYQVKSKPVADVDIPINQTNTTVYSTYYNNDDRVVRECTCTSYSLCNQNINTCLTQTAPQIEATDSTPSSISTATTTISVDVTSITTDSTGTSVGSTIISTDSTSISLASTITSVGLTINSTDSPITSLYSTGNTTESSATSLYSTGVSTASPNITTDFTTVSTFTNTFTSSNSSLTSPIITISNTQAPITGGEQGLGSAATAGIACGIIFSVLIFAGEIAFFKLVYPRLNGNGGGGRAARYAAETVTFT